MTTTTESQDAGTDNRKRELVAAVALSLTTLLSAWCGYQSSEWADTQADRILQSMIAGRKSTEQTISANRLRVLDISLFVAYVRFLDMGNTKAAEVSLHRFRPEARTAIDAWLAKKPLQNPDAPQTPFDMSEYTLATEQKARTFSQDSERLYKEGEQAGTTGQRYSLLTVLCAAGLFFLGVQTKYASLGTVRIILGISVLILAFVLVVMLRLPIAS